MAEYYQTLAIDTMQGKGNLELARKNLISELKVTGKSRDIEKRVKKELEKSFEPDELKIPKGLCYLTGKTDYYLHDMDICQRFAEANRNTIANNIIKKMDGVLKSSFIQSTTISN